MSDESFNNQAAGAAPDQGNTATPETEVHGEPEGEGAEPKTFTQEDIDRIVAAEKAKVERRLKRELAQAAEQPKQVSAEPPKQDQFRSAEEYIDALAEHKAQQKIEQSKSREQSNRVVTEYENRVDEARTKYEDYDQVAHGEHVRITPAMAETIMASEIGPEIAYHLGKNPEEGDRIAKLPPLQQAREIGKIEATLTANPPVKKASSAPEPIKPVGSRSTSPSYETTDPRSVKSMSTAEWIAAENKRLAKKHAR